VKEPGILSLKYIIIKQNKENDFELSELYNSRIECTLLIFLISRVEKLPAWPGIEPTTSDLYCQPDVFGQKAMVTIMS